MVAPRRSWYLTATGADMVAMVSGRFPAVDVAALAPQADEFVAIFREGVQPGTDGWVDDSVAFVRPWGFELADVGVPTVLWVGGQDLSCPVAHSVWMETHIEGAELHIEPDEGHLSIGLCRMGEMVASVVRAAGV
jgi:pimeloyl-ACP methyl ester carboxylesterase